MFFNPSLISATTAKHTVTYFLDHFFEFKRVFDAWQHNDSQVLLKDMLDHYKNLELLWMQVHAGPESNEWKSRIRDQRQVLKEQIERLPGGKEELKHLKMSMSENWKLAGLSEKPPPLSPASEGDIETLLPSAEATLAGDPAAETSKSLDGQLNTLDTGSSEAVKFMENLLTEQQSGVSNEQLLHEILLNPSFRMGEEMEAEEHGDVLPDEDDPRVLAERVRRLATQAFFDQVKLDMDASPEKKISWTKSLLEDVVQVCKIFYEES